MLKDCRFSSESSIKLVLAFVRLTLPFGNCLSQASHLSFHCFHLCLSSPMLNSIYVGFVNDEHACMCENSEPFYFFPPYHLVFSSANWLSKLSQTQFCMCQLQSCILIKRIWTNSMELLYWKRPRLTYEREKKWK